MKKEIYAKLKKITRELFENHELEYSWYVDSQSNIVGELKKCKNSLAKMLCVYDSRKS